MFSRRRSLYYHHRIQLTLSTHLVFMIDEARFKKSELGYSSTESIPSSDWHLLFTLKSISFLLETGKARLRMRKEVRDSHFGQRLNFPTKQEENLLSLSSFHTFTSKTVFKNNHGLQAKSSCGEYQTTFTSHCKMRRWME